MNRDVIRRSAFSHRYVVAAGRAERITRFVALCARHETIHPYEPMECQGSRNNILI